MMLQSGLRIEYQYFIFDVVFTVALGASSGTANKLDVDGNLYIGGYKGNHKYK